MRSRAARLTCGALAWIAFGSAAFFVFQSEKQTTEMQAALRAFDARTREALDALADLRAAQQAYVAAGQSVTLWAPKVTSALDVTTTAITGLRQDARNAETQSALDEAARTVAEFSAVDQRALDYIKTDQPLMAADVVFTEGNETSLRAARQVETALVAERQASEASHARRRMQEALATATAAVFAGLSIVLLVPAGRPKALSTDALATSGTGWLAESQPTNAPADRADELLLRANPDAPGAYVSPPPAGAALTAAAKLCTDFGRVGDVDELRALIARAADILDASGLVVCLGEAGGGDLRPVIAHGYSPQTIARMATVKRSANNAAAAAYRAGQPQIVLARPGTASGAVVVPLLSSEGCIGTLSAEIRGGGETSDSVQALATIFAAHLAGVLATPSEAIEQHSASRRTGIQP